MALKNIVKASGLAALGLACSAAVVVAAEGAGSQLFAPLPVMPPMPDWGIITNIINWVFGTTTGDSMGLMYRLFFLIIIAAIFSYFLTPVFRDNKYFGALIGILAGIVTIKTLPVEVFTAFGQYVGLVGGSVILFMLPLLIVYFVWANTKDNNYKWKVRGLTCIIAGGLHMAALGFFPITLIFDIGLIVAGVIMLFQRFRVPAIGHISEKASVALHADLRKDIVAVLDEHGLTIKALQLAQRLRTTFNGMSDPIPAFGSVSTSKIKRLRELEQLQSILMREKKLFGNMMSNIVHTISVYKTSGGLNATALTELNAIETEATTAKTSEATALNNSTELFHKIYTQPNSKTSVDGWMDSIITHLANEDRLLRKMRQTLTHVESEISS